MTPWCAPTAVAVLLSLAGPGRGESAIASAGHPLPLHLGAAGVAEAEFETGFMLGAFPEAEYFDTRWSLQRGEGLLLYTDGITEAFNAADEQFGEWRLAEAVSLAAGSMKPDGLVRHVASAIARFRGDLPQSDDMTLLACCRIS